MLDGMLSHVILHLVLCSAATQSGSTAPVQIHVGVFDKGDQAVVKRDFTAARGSGDQATIEFDMPWGVYRLDASVPASDCHARDYFALSRGNIRTFTEPMFDGAAPQRTPALAYGIGPQSFHDSKPQFVFFNENAVACDHALPEPLPSRVDFEHDGDAYYASIYGGVGVPKVPILLVLRFQTPEHRYRYIRLVPLSLDWVGWPTSIHYDLDQKKMTALDKTPFDILLCPKVYETWAG
jgi:hypothetical protein